MPLDLRREELGLRYIMRMKSSHENPLFKVLSTTESRNFGPRSSKPFQIRLNEKVDDVIKEQKN